VRSIVFEATGQQLVLAEEFTQLYLNVKELQLVTVEPLVKDSVVMM